jgi:hypothetical protein
MRKTTLLFALTITSAIASTPSLAKIPSRSAGTHEATGAWVYARNDRYTGGHDMQINRPQTGPELVNEFPFRSEG